MNQFDKLDDCTLNKNILDTQLPCNWHTSENINLPENISSYPDESRGTCEELPENPVLFNETSFDKGSFGKVSIHTKDNKIFGSDEKLKDILDFCNKNNNCIVKKKLDINNDNEKDISNEVNILWILSHLPKKYNKFFPKIYGYKDNTHNQTEIDFDNDDDDGDNSDDGNNSDDGDSDDMYMGGGSITGEINIYQTYSGQTLYNYMNENENMSFDKIMRIMMFIAKGLCILHSCQICHYDLKPQNITVKIDINGAIDGINIIDFGASRFIKNGKAYLILRNNTGFFTELYEGQHISNYLYSGPDISDNSSVKTQLSDIWNIGSIFVHVLTGIPVSILLIINDNHNIEKLAYSEIYKLYKETKIWNPIMFSISLNMYENKEIWSVYLLVEKFLTKFFNSKKNITNSHIPDFIKDLSRCFMFLGNHNESKNRISANELFRSLKKVFNNKEEDSLDSLLSST